MTTPSTSGSVLDRPLNHPELDHKSGRVSHIINPQGNKTGGTLVTESRVFGTELEALCGHRFTAQHDPRQYPICEPCKEAWQQRFGPDDQGPPEA